jgi:hypothetical protein
VAPVRVIEGQRTKLTRVAHGIAYDPLHDVIIGTEPLAGSIVFFRGGSHGNVAPIRVIQGPHTSIHYPFQPAVDVKHNELWVADIVSHGLLVFPLTGNGDIAPLRVIRGNRTQMTGASGVAVDTDHDLVIASGSTHGAPAIFTFDRTASGNVPPKTVISGPSTGIVSGWHVQYYRGRIYAIASNHYLGASYDQGGFEPRPNCDGPLLAFTGPLGFVGVWNETDTGDAPPRAIIMGPASELLHPDGLALDPGHNELFASDSVRNGVFGYLVPDFFGGAAQR